MPALNARLDPEHAGPTTVRAQPYSYSGSPTVGLGWVEIDGLTIQSTHTASLRLLAAKILEAADLADAITRKHAAHEEVAGGGGADYFWSECACGGVHSAPTPELLREVTDLHYGPVSA